MSISAKKSLRLFSVLLASLLVVLAGCGKSQSNNSAEMESTQVEESSTSNQSEPSTESDESGEPEYARDEVVNSFITAYNSLSPSPITNISEGNIRTKFFGSTYGHSIEMINGANGRLHISVSANSSDPDMASLRDAFHDVVATLDPNLSDEEIYAAYDAALEYGYLIEDEALGNVNYMWCPTVELSRGTSLGHFEVSTDVDSWLAAISS